MRTTSIISDRRDTTLMELRLRLTQAECDEASGTVKVHFKHNSYMSIIELRLTVVVCTYAVADAKSYPNPEH